ncbi:MAG: iron chaperone [Anaerolineales bacterium]
MKTKQITPQNIDEYIAGFPTDVQEILQKIRMTIRKAAPDAEETISYLIPTFTLKGKYLIYFAAYKKHIGLYPVPAGDAEFNEQLSVYQTGKGTLQFPLDKPIPYDLISKIVKVNRKENLERVEAKGKKK